MYTIQFSPLAKEDLIKLKIYLESEFDKEIASIIIKRIIEHIKRFEAFPLMGRPLINVINIPTDYMYFVIEKNYVFYRIEMQSVKIVRILDTRRDFINVLFG